MSRAAITRAARALVAGRPLGNVALRLAVALVLLALWSGSAAVFMALEPGA